jgi:hypothetical protein
MFGVIDMTRAAFEFHPLLAALVVKTKAIRWPHPLC